jgi:NADH-quinone oxidoreductase subunit G
MDDVAHEPTLNVSERGDRAFIGRFEGKDLDHPWAANVVDLCPVGALLSKDFLNKARAWELDRTASICPNCTQGCNTIIESRDNVIVRMKPRPNPDVNAYFMCDYGRLNYRWINARNRCELPMIRSGGALAPSEWEPALAAAVDLLRGKRAFVVASPMLSNESLFLLSRLAGGRGAFRVEQGAEAPLAGVPDLALRADRAANVHGAEALGFRRADDPFAGVDRGDVLIVAGEDLDAADTRALDAPGSIILLGTTIPEALRDRVSVVLPITNFAEEEGTFTNLRGRVQRYLQAKAAPGLARPAWFVAADLLGQLGHPAQFFLASEVFAELARENGQFADLSYETLGLRGLPIVEQQGAGSAT